MKTTKMIVGASLASAVALGFSGCASSAESAGAEDEVTLTYATFVGADHPTSQAFEAWAERVTTETDGAVTFETYYDGTLCAAGELGDCVSSGTADIGFVIPGYEPANFPLASFSNIGFVTNDLQAQVDSFSELYEESDDLRNEFENQGLHTLYSTASNPYLIATNEEVENFDDLAGLGLRAPGDTTEALDALGVNPVAITIAEAYESIDRGVIDGIITALDGLVDARLQEVTPYIYDIGEYWGNGMMHHVVVNSSAWESLAPETHEIMSEASADISSSFFATYDSTDRDCGLLEEAGVEVLRIGPEGQGQTWSEEAQGLQMDAWLGRAEQASDDPEALFDRFVEIVEEKESGDNPTPVSQCMD